MPVRLIAATVALLGVPADAQSFTTAVEVHPILEMTQMNWIAMREYDGHDLVYFAELLNWRCGLEAVF